MNPVLKIMEYQQVLGSCTGWAVQLLKHMTTSGECTEWDKQWITWRLAFKAGRGALRLEGGGKINHEPWWRSIQSSKKKTVAPPGREWLPVRRAMSKDLLSKWMSRQCQRKASKVSRGEGKWEPTGTVVKRWEQRVMRKSHSNRLRSLRDEKETWGSLTA